MLTKLIKSNFRNDLSHMLTFFLIMLLSVFMLHSGIMIIKGYQEVFSEKKEELNLADVVVYSALTKSDQDKIEEIIHNTDFLESYEKHKALHKEFKIEKEGYEEDSKDMMDMSSMNLIVLPYGEWGDIEKPHFVEKSDEEYENPIYLSVFTNTNFIKKDLGDSIDVRVGETYYTFQIAGFYEGVLSASIVNAVYVKPSLYNEWAIQNEKKWNENSEKALENNEEYIEQSENLNDEEKETLRGDMGYESYVFYMKTVQGEKPLDAAGKLSKSFSEHDINATALDIDTAIEGCTYMQNLIAAVLAAFAIIITIISMIIIYFRITNSIEQNIESIGALKALGYTSVQIRLGMVIEFTLTTLMSVILGVGLSYLALSPVETIMRGFSGVVWVIRPDAIAFMVTAFIILITVLIVSMVSTRKIMSLDPVIALRFGIDSHNFKKNRAPIESTPGNLTWIMSLKSMLSSTKQNILVFVIMLSIGFVVSIAIFMAYNCSYDATHLLRMLNLVSGDVSVVVDDEDALSEISKLPEVENIWWQNTCEMSIDNYSVYCYITEDWASLSEVNVYKGRVPKFDNEIAMGGVCANRLGLSIGDEVEVSYGGKDFSYLITGIEQDSNNTGMDISMTEEGAKHLNYVADKNDINIKVYNHSLKNSQKVIEDVTDMYGDKLISYINYVEYLQKGENPVIAIASGLVILLVIVSLLIIVLSMNLLVKTMIIKKQREIGIKKAIGFSSSQLRMELVLSMLPLILAGSTLGTVIALFESNNVMKILLTAVGVTNSNMDVFSWMAVLGVLFVVITSFIIIWTLSRRIKKISAYSLITE